MVKTVTIAWKIRVPFPTKHKCNVLIFILQIIGFLKKKCFTSNTKYIQTIFFLNRMSGFDLAGNLALLTNEGI